MNNEILYIELPAAMKSLIFVILLLVVGLIKIYIDSKNKQSSYSDPFSSFSLPLYLIREHSAKFILMTFKRFDDIKLMYIEFLKKYNALAEGDEAIEINRLKYLVDNKIDVSRTVKKGIKEAHKNRLLILIFLFNVAVKSGKISDLDKVYLDNVYKELGIAHEVYQTIRNKYIKDKEKQNFVLYDSNYKIKEAYESLKIKQNSNLKDVKDAYRKLAKQYHPDAIRNKKDSNYIKISEYKFTEITMAYDLLKRHLKKK